MNYQQLDAKLQGRCYERRKLTNNTWAIRDSPAINIRLYSTDILVFTKSRVLVYARCWRTSTTLSRINWYLPSHCIHTVKGEWFWSNGAPFTDGDFIDKAGKLHSKLLPKEFEIMINKPIAKTWWFKSSSGSDVYETLQYTDGSTSCNCPGWVRRPQRSCKHTRMVDGGMADELSIKHVANHEVQINIKVTTTKPAAQLGFGVRKMVIDRKEKGTE
jgi:hypothetical protein